MFLNVTKEEENIEKNRREWMRKEREKVGNRTTPSFNFLPVLRSFLFLSEKRNTSRLDSRIGEKLLLIDRDV